MILPKIKKKSKHFSITLYISSVLLPSQTHVHLPPAAAAEPPTAFHLHDLRLSVNAKKKNVCRCCHLYPTVCQQSAFLFFFPFFCKAANWIIRGALYTPISKAGAAGGGIARPYRRKVQALKKEKENTNLVEAGKRQQEASSAWRGESAIHYSPAAF